MKKKVDLVGSRQDHQSCVAIGHTAAEMLPYCRKWEVKEVKDVCFG